MRHYMVTRAGHWRYNSATNIAKTPAQVAVDKYGQQIIDQPLKQFLLRGRLNDIVNCSRLHQHVVKQT